MSTTESSDQSTDQSAGETPVITETTSSSSEDEQLDVQNPEQPQQQNQEQEVKQEPQQQEVQQDVKQEQPQQEVQQDVKQEQEVQQEAKQEQEVKQEQQPPPPQQQPPPPQQQQEQEIKQEETVETFLKTIDTIIQNMSTNYSNETKAIDNLNAFRNNPNKPLFIRDQNQPLNQQIHDATEKHNWNLDDYRQQKEIVDFTRQMRYDSVALSQTMNSLYNIQLARLYEKDNDNKLFVDVMNEMLDLRNQEERLNNYRTVYGIETINEIILVDKLVPFIERIQIENWTGSKISKVVFNSETDDWNTIDKLQESCLTKNKLVFIVEDVKGNRFGGYVPDIISAKNVPMTDSNVFLFTLKTDNRLNGMMKFKPKENQQTFTFNPTEQILFSFGTNGADLKVFNQNNKQSSGCTQTSFDYCGISNTLCGGTTFIPKGFFVLQMK